MDPFRSPRAQFWAQKGEGKLKDSLNIYSRNNLSK